MIRAAEELRELLQRHSIKKGEPGEFRLASGALSSYYCNTKQVTLSPQGSELIGQLVLPMVHAVGGEAVGGLAMGALFVSSPVVCASQKTDWPVYGFAVRQKQKEHGLETSVEESFHPDGRPLLCEGRKAVVVDDVITSGGSVMKAIDRVRELGCQIVSVISLVDRRAGGGAKLRELGLPYCSLYETDDTGDLHLASALGSTTARLEPARAWA